MPRSDARHAAGTDRCLSSGTYLRCPTLGHIGRSGRQEASNPFTRYVLMHVKCRVERKRLNVSRHDAADWFK